MGNGEDYFNQFAAGKIYINDQFVDEPPHVPSAAEILAATKKEKLAALRQLLNSTDYKAIKYAEGALTAEEYEPTRLQRQAWRDAYNKIEIAETMSAVEIVLW